MGRNCEDCRKSLASATMIYGCSCNPNVFFCYSCEYQNRCYKCFGSLSRLKTETCSCCYQSDIKTHFLQYREHYHFCYSCVLGAYESQRSKGKIKIPLDSSR